VGVPVDREVARDVELIVAGGGDGGRLERDLGDVLGVEEVGRQEVAVALGLALSGPVKAWLSLMPGAAPPGYRA